MKELRIQEILEAPAARVFAAWCDVDKIREWFAPGEMTVPEVVADIKPGGRYRIVMQEPDGRQHIVGGEYREVVPNERLRFSWQWEGRPDVTEVNVILRALDDRRTELTLIHTEFATAEARDEHGKGWAGCLANLRRYLLEDS
ncbi:SRPBCC domain-containing protein [Sinorhizobium garamanticum]|uniref:SRPBCC domain-containing protein n=1 Tax=Sinorhizobium garamanticum TaxID=680247 RepID=A0ABY8DBH6_9HYPH|nr:SRPBCC domain-containing protein [Sinorhizobium garamanticum]WEX86308.1 SRPBCC domain-containing protein [Sinorhizobium garamanticum]